MFFTNLTISLIVFILSYIIPKDDNLYLFGSGRGGMSFVGNPKYLYLYIIRNNIDLNIIWITKSNIIYKQLSENNYPVLKFYTLKAFWKILKAKYLIIDSSPRGIYLTGHPFGKFNIIQTWHGTPIKKIWYSADRERKGMSNSLIETSLVLKIKKRLKLFTSLKYKLIISCSKDVSKILISSSLNNNVKITGYPRNDVFFNKNLIFNNYKEKLNLSKYKKVILYCPTFRDNYKIVRPFSSDFFININEYLKDTDGVLLIKKHQYENKIDIPEELSNIRDVSYEINDVQDLLAFTDILISDYSSIFFDFILLNRPIIYYSYDFDEYQKNCRGMYFDYYKDIAGPFAKQEDELLELIKSVDVWFNDDLYQKKYKEFKNRFNYYQDGESCKRLLDLLKQ